MTDKNYKNEDELLIKDNCKEYSYVPAIFPPKKRIIVIGDLHGDYKLTISCLKLAKLINNNEKWIGKDTFVVQIGDQVDRCRPFNYKCDDPLATIHDEASDIKILKLFTKLNEEAIKKGGAVISLLGNHEILNSMGNLNYVSYKGLREFDDYKDPKDTSIKFKSGEEARKHAFAPGNEYGKFLACTRISSVIIGSFLFVHGGIIPGFINKLQIKDRDYLYKLNHDVKKWLLGLIDKKYVANIIDSYKFSLFWNRILGNIPPNINNRDSRCIKYLDPVLELFKVNSMIIGHTPQFHLNKQGINNTCDNKLWRVDIGGSSAFNKFDEEYIKSNKIIEFRKAQVLEILDDKKISILK